MEVEVKVRLKVAGCDENEFNPDAVKPGDPLRARVVDSVRAAVENAVRWFHNAGFRHDLEAQIALEPFCYAAREVNAPRVPREWWAVYAWVKADRVDRLKIRFDAGPWFAQASDQEIRALAKEGWGSCCEADAVALFCEDVDPEVDRFFDIIDGLREFDEDYGGFECYVNGDTALKWLRANRPAVLEDQRAD